MAAIRQTGEDRQQQIAKIEITIIRQQIAKIAITIIRQQIAKIAIATIRTQVTRRGPNEMRLTAVKHIFASIAVITAVIK